MELVPVVVPPPFDEVPAIDVDAPPVGAVPALPVVVEVMPPPIVVTAPVAPVGEPVPDDEHASAERASKPTNRVMDFGIPQPSAPTSRTPSLLS